MKRRSKDQLTISALFEAARKRSRGGDPTQESVDSERASSHSINLELNPMTSEAYETADLSIEVTGSGGSGDHVSDRVEVLAFVNGDERDPAEACRAISECTAVGGCTVINSVSYDVVGNDVGELVDPNKLQDDTKLSLLLGHFVPDSHFPFPPRQEKKSGRDTKRYFQLQWLEKYNWLVYSPSQNGGYCLPCALFSTDQSTGQLCKQAMVKFTKASETLRKHDQQECHKVCCTRASHFIATRRHGQANILQLVVDQGSKQKQENIAKLCALIKTVEFCGRQNISLRGHREKGFTWDPNEQLACNPGNFLALLRFRVDAGDEHLLRDFHMSQSARGLRASYLSPTIQNELIECCGKVIQEDILRDVRKAPFFSVCADESADASNQEQLPLVLRFVDESGLIREELAEFLCCSDGTTGLALANLLLTTMTEMGLQPKEKLRGQGYDGAGNMAGPLQGCASRVTAECPKALYLHCSAHCLNLCIIRLSKLPFIQSMWSSLLDVNIFFKYSPKRAHAMAEIVHEWRQGEGGDSKKKLVDLCKTRWVARHEALVVFAELYPAVLTTLETISRNRGGTVTWNATSCSSATSLHNNLTQFRFLATFVITSKLMAAIQSLTSSLQEKATDVAKAYKHVARVISVLQDMRDNINDRHGEWWTDVQALCLKTGVQESLPRYCSRQTYRGNIPAQTPVDYYRLNVSIPLLDDIISQMNIRFGNLQQLAMKGMSFMPTILLRDASAKADILEFGKAYQSDFPTASPNLDALSAEIDLWIAILKSLPISEHPATVAEALRLAMGNPLIPTVSRLLRLVCTWPVTSCECERSISALNRVKTSLRASMSQIRFNGLVMLHVHYNRKLSHLDVIRLFSARNPRKIILPNFGEPYSDSELANTFVLDTDSPEDTWDTELDS